MDNAPAETPLVSVVAAVFNAGPTLSRSIQSILGQSLREIELVAVDDGSTDGSAQTLEDIALADPRMHVLRRPHRGLTPSLIAGCAAARGRFIARHDAGDISLPGRLAKQLAAAKPEPGAALVSCYTRFVDPDGEELYTVQGTSEEATKSLSAIEQSNLHGPSHHGASLFPRALYESVGGYREAFRVGQDLDLWVRLTEDGRHVVVPKVLYEATVSPDSISGMSRPEQLRAKEAVLASARLRRRGQSDEVVLGALEEDLAAPGKGNIRRRRAAALYFLGACLRKRNPAKARSYFRRAIKENPLHMRAWARLTGSWVR